MCGRHGPIKTNVVGGKMTSKNTGKITVLNPRGTPPHKKFVPMAPRPESLDGKTIYFVDIRFFGGDIFLKEMINWFSENMPKVKTLFRKKVGDYYKDDPELWAEVKAHGDAMVTGVGH
jgi:hypothetical protein